MKKILVLEDEANIRSFVVINLRRSGFEPIEAENGEMALEKLKQNPDICLALLDVMLPDIDGFEVCRRIRATGSKMGIIMLTAKSQEIDKVTGLMTGADDYVTKPFSPAELTARVDALIRRLGVDEEEKNSVEIVSGPFVLNVRNRTLEKNGQRLKLTQIEYLLMKLFMENPGKAMSREDILSAVWGSEFGGELKTDPATGTRYTGRENDSVVRYGNGYGNTSADKRAGTKNATANSTLHGSYNNPTGTPAGQTAASARGLSNELRYRLMLENARVHDTDGFLLDGENAHYNTFR